MCAIIVALFGAFETTAQSNIVETDDSIAPPKRIAAEQPAAFDHFGSSVALHDAAIVIGSPRDDKRGIDAGAVHVFERLGSEWTHVAKLIGIDTAARDHFGNSVAVDGNIVVVGARDTDSAGADSGAADVFEKVGAEWVPSAKLLHRNAAPSERFGQSVSIHARTLLVGAPGVNASGTRSGAVFVFEQSDDVWVEKAMVTPEDSVPHQMFGFTVSIRGDLLAVGAYADSKGGMISGAAYVFRSIGGQWTQEARLSADDAAPLDEFGWSISISGDTVAVGSPGDDDAGHRSGSAYIFRRVGSDWTCESKLIAPDSHPGDAFGSALALSGDLLVVGAHFADQAGIGSDTAFLFTRTGSEWTHWATLAPDDVTQGSEFGNSVAARKDVVAIGALRDSCGLTAAGSVYVYESLKIPAQVNGSPAVTSK